MLPTFWQNLPAKQGETGFGAVAAAQSQPGPSARVPPPVARRNRRSDHRRSECVMEGRGTAAVKGASLGGRLTRRSPW